MDEIWNYNFGYNICKGLLPYTDFNCIITPLSAYISGLFLTVFGNNLICFRIFGIVLLATTFFSLFYLLWSCGKNRILAFTCSSFLFALCYLIWIYNYNNFNLLLIIIALLIEFQIYQQGKTESVLHHFFVGVIYGAVFLSKQSVGALFLLYNFVFCLLLWFTKKQNRRYAAIRLLSSAILPVLFVLYLLVSDSFNAFWDYAIAGIGTFTLRITYFEYISSSLINLIVGITPLIITGFSIVAIIKKKSVVSCEFHIISLIISWIGLSVAYPLCDYIHMCIGLVPFSVCAFCCFSPPSLKKWEKIICIIVPCVIFLSMCVSEIKISDSYKNCELNNFKGLIIQQELENHIATVDQYITSNESTETEVLIVDSYAAIYLLPIDKYYKDFSLLNQGNLGTQTISDLLHREKAVYLINSDRSNINPQSHFELIEYIVTHYRKIGEVSGFDIYEGK